MSHKSKFDSAGQKNHNFSGKSQDKSKYKANSNNPKSNDSHLDSSKFAETEKVSEPLHNDLSDPNFDNYTSKHNLQENLDDISVDAVSQIKILELEKKLDEFEVRNFSLGKEIQDWKEKSLRIGAEIQNLQKHHELETFQVQKKVKKNLVLQLLEFLNTLNLSFSYVPSSDDEKINHFVKTLKISFDRLLVDLKVSQVEILLAQPGDDFNPEFMTILNGPESIGESVIVRQLVTLGLKVDGQIIQPVSILV